MSKLCLLLAVAIGFSTPLRAQNGAAGQTNSSSWNGIFVGEPKVYDDRSLQLLLNGLKARLGQLSGLDQGSLTGHLGALQGSSATTYGFSMQANGNPLPGATTTATQAGATTTQTTGGTATSTPATGTTTIVTAPTGTTTTTTTTSAAGTSTAANQTVVNNPGSTLQTQTTAPAVTPTPPSIPTIPSYSLPSTFATSSSDILGEQMQLSYQIINLQMLLDGSFNDQYVKGTHLMKQHSTIGMPISITVPPSKDYRGAVAEIEITVCDPPVVDNTSVGPSLMTIMPQEKTYNVASVVSKSTSLGASAVVAGLVNVGANFLWGHQTYYLVEDQDTLAVQMPPAANGCPNFQKYDQAGNLVDAGPSIPLTFAWQFRPVLGQPIVKQGLRQNFVQLSLPTGPELACTARVTIDTYWRKYDRKRGVVGAELPSSRQQQQWQVASFYSSPFVTGVGTRDNHDGSTTVTVSGNFLPGTRVRLGVSYLDESTPGFQLTATYLRFTASDQALALNVPAVVTRDGIESNILTPEAGTSATMQPCAPLRTPAGNAAVEPADPPFAPVSLSRSQVRRASLLIGEAGPELPQTQQHEPQHIDQPVTIEPFTDSMVRVTVKTEGIPDSNLGGPYPLVVILGGKAFGLGDLPFASVTDNTVSFLAPQSLVKTQGKLIIQRLFLRNGSKSFDILQMSQFSITGISVVSANKAKTDLAIVGSALQGAKILEPAGASVTTQPGGTMALVSLTADQLSAAKQLLIQHNGEPPILVSLPDSEAADSKPHLAAHDPIPTGTNVSYSITGGTPDSVVSVSYLGKQLPFTLALDKKSIVIALPSEMTASSGIRSLLITYSDGSTDRYAVTVSTAKAK
jgi:hypothetical protein